MLKDNIYVGGKKNMYKSKVFGIGVVILIILALLTTMTSSAQLRTINKKDIKHIFGKKSLIQEESYPLEWENMTSEEIAMYVEDLLEESPWNNTNDPKNPPIKEPVNAGGSSAVYKPPWDYYEDGNEKEGGGIGIAWAESGADENKGYAHTITESGPGIGGHTARAWIVHGFWFTAPIQETYTFTFEYKIKGWAVGWSADNIIPPGSGFSGVQIYLIFQVSGSEETVVLVNQQTIPFVHTTYEEWLDKTVTYTINANFLELETARVSVIAVAKSTTSGVLAAAAGAEGYIDDLSNPGVGGALKKVTVSWTPDNNPPSTQITDGPSGTIDYDDVIFTWTGTDDKTSTRNLMYSYKLEGYDSSWSGWTSFKSKSYDNLPDGSYTFKVKAKDTSGNEDKTPAERSFIIDTDSTPPSVEIEKPSPSGIYFQDEILVWLSMIALLIFNSDSAFVVGDITVEVDASDDVSGVNRVEFYVDGSKRHTDSDGSNSYSWRWSNPRFGRYELSVTAYDNSGNKASDQLDVWIFNI
jgi:hypothetical protein